MVEDHSAVWPAVMIHKTQIREESYSNCLKAPLVTNSETIAIDLVKKKKSKDDVTACVSIVLIVLSCSLSFFRGCRKSRITAFFALNPFANVIMSVFWYRIGGWRG